jgi:ABC-type transport system involved in multi-copper enzyme maturation permease subunit
MGNNALRDIDAGLGNPNDRGLVVAGRILGIIGTVLMILGIIAYGVIFLMAIMAGGMNR